jgi:hypothetical protein
MKRQGWFMTILNLELATPPKVNPGAVQILTPPAMINPGIYPKPIAFGGTDKSVNQNGFLEPLPNHLTVAEID